MKKLLLNSRFLTRTLILLFLFFMSSVNAQVTTLQNWSNLYNNTGSGATSAYTVPAGSNSNRVLAVAIASSQSATAARTVSITYGGQTMTLAGGNMADNSIRVHTAIYYLNEAGLDAATNSNLIYSVTGGTTRGTTVWAAVFDNVDQATPLTDTQNYDSNNANATTFTFGTALTINTNDQAVYILSSVRNNNTGQRTISSVPANFAIEDQQQIDNTDGIRNAMVNRTVPTSNTSSTCSTTMSGTSLGSMTGVSFKGCIQATANAGSAMTAICQGGTSAGLGGSVGGSATGGTWSSSVAGGTFTPSATNLNATWSPPSAYSGTATLTLTTSGGSCGVGSASKTLVVGPIPTAVTANASAATICLGGTVDLTSSGNNTTIGAISETNTTVIAIPDNTPAGVTSSITVPATCSTANQVATVTLNITHTWNSDLNIYLIAPNGSQIALSLGNGGSGDNYNATFQTGGATLPTGNTTINGTFAPQEAFSLLTGSATGLWTLRVIDGAAADIGTINSWGITFASTTCPLTYSWTSTPSGYTSSSQNPTGVVPTVTTTYTVTATNIFGCTASATTTVSINSTTWTSASGGSWSNGAPSATTAAVIEFDYTSVGNVDACSLTVTNNAVVIITSGDSVNLNGSLTVDAGSSFTLENNANLLQGGTTNTNSGDITVKRNSSALIRQDYTLWSAPVAGQNLLAFSPSTLTTRFYTYSTTANQYSAVVPSTTDFATATGYLIRMPNNHPSTATVWAGAFAGVPNNGDYGFTMVDNGVGQRFNAVGNPYPSPIDATAFVGNTTNAANTTGALYFWRKTNNAASPSYCTWTTGGFVTNSEAQVFDPNDVIQKGQGFFVEASGSGTSLVFDNTMRTDDHANQFFRNQNTIERNRIWINATNAEGLFSQTLVGYMTDATNAVDYAIDGKYINDGPIALTSIIDNEKFVIQGRSLPFDVTDSVPLEFKATTAGNYTIAIDHVDGLFLGEQAIYLRDLLMGVDHDLKAAAYSFTSDAGTFSERFEIVYQSTLSVTNPNFENGVVVYSKNKVIEINAGLESIAAVRVVDIRGSVVAHLKDVNATSVSIPLSQIGNQVLIVQITGTNGKTISKKVVH